ncbi:MAG: hypothetical protein LBQ81_02570 [Zoogloeaceae bacterium]|jgi:hypothetical protein|nr:hypothetical protein [Zoogloeaceae bacterium]
MKKIACVLLRISGSLWFFPAICVGGLAVGISAFERLNAWDTRQTVRAPNGLLFYIMAEIPGEKEIVPVHLGGLEKFKADFPNARFLLSSPGGELNREEEFSSWQYSVVTQENREQKITVRYSGEDYHSTSIYRVSGLSLTPLHLRIHGPGESFFALFVILPVSILLARFLQHSAQRMYKRLSPETRNVSDERNHPLRQEP